jgi:hypothetical protein
MGLFGNKSTRASKPARKTCGAADSERGAATHRLTLDLSRAHTLATMLASSRSSEFIEIPDLVAGMYMYEWDRLSEYWPEERRDEMEDVLREMCNISPQRWNNWIQQYDTRRKGFSTSRWEKLKVLRKHKPKEENPPRHSTALRVLFKNAGEFTPFRDTDEGRDIPILTTECVLLCIAQTSGLEIGKRLRETGLDVGLLERAALDPKRSPRR